MTAVIVEYEHTLRFPYTLFVGGHIEGCYETAKAAKAAAKKEGCTLIEGPMPEEEAP
jgi:hypothetical protein